MRSVQITTLQAGSEGSLRPPQIYAVVLYTRDVRVAGGQLENNFYNNRNPALQARNIDDVDGDDDEDADGDDDDGDDDDDDE